jgi:hypothetical protein
MTASATCTILVLRTANNIPVVDIDVIGFAALRLVAYFRRFVLGVRD